MRSTNFFWMESGDNLALFNSLILKNQSMKVFYAIILFAIPSVAFAQNLANNQSVGSEKSLAFQKDPFTSYMIHEVDNPCKDSRYLSLRNISPDKMSDKENTVFKQKSKACQDFITKVKDSAAPELGIGENNRDPRHIEPYTYYVFGGCAIALAVIFVLID